MYPFIDATWNAIKGECPHLCGYCYMNRWGKQKPPRLDRDELKTDLGEDQFIFVGSSCDIFANEIPYVWLFDTLKHCNRYPKNKYLFQSKNPEGFDAVAIHLDPDIEYVLCTTIETNREYEVMGNTPTTIQRAIDMARIPIEEKHVTIEPIMDFDARSMRDMILSIRPSQVNVGADSGGNSLPEPDKEKILWLIEQLEDYTLVVKKQNLNRLIK